MAEKITVDLNQFRDWYNEDPVDRLIMFDTNQVGVLSNKVYTYSRKLNHGIYVDSPELATALLKEKADENDLIIFNQLLSKHPEWVKENPSSQG